jgi:preprotein translocase subunit SecD
MIKNLRWRVITILVITLVCGAFGVYPILAQRFHLPAPAWLMAYQLPLGLDLKGGVHLRLRVNTDDALRLVTASTSEQLRESLTKGNIPVGAVTVLSPMEFKIEGIPVEKDADFRAAADEVAGANFDRNPIGNGVYTFAMKPNVVVNLREQTVDQALQTIERRVNELGVTEPSIARQSQGDQILVQLPGVTDVAHAKDIIQSTALLELKLVEDGPASNKDDLLKSHGGKIPPDMEVLQGAPERGNGETGTLYYLVRKTPVVTGQDLRNAREGPGQNSEPAVHFELKPDGARKFGKATGENIGRGLAIVLDNRVHSAPRIDGRITDNGEIHGGFTAQSAADLALKLRSGALPASLSYLEERVVGPTLGADSIRAGLTASAVSLIAVMMFMLWYYKLSGVNAVVALILNLVILLALMAYWKAVMTLPGIAGFVLTMGIGVDSNVLIFERIKEELEAQRGVRASINAGFSRVWWTLLDTHITALISAAFLFQFGTGPIRGFAVTLFLGLVSNLFTATFVSKTLFEAVLRERQVATLSI